ncbi:MAG TPA: SH3 domain-containing protein, partial [Anaerolineae bacterium]
RTAVLLAFALLVVAVLSLSIGQALGSRAVPVSIPTRTPRPTWTPAAGGFVVASPTLDTTQFPVPAQPPAPASTPQPIVPGQSQALVVSQPNGAPGQVLTVVVIIVTATPPPAGTVLPGTPGPPPVFGPVPSGGPPTAQAPLVAPTATGTPPPPVMVTVKQPQAFVRQGPGMVYPPVTQLDAGTAITVIGRNRGGDWWKICCVNNSDVWIADALVSVQGPLWTVPEVTNIPPTPVPTATPAPTPTIAPTPTYAWFFHLEGTPQPYPMGQNYFSIGAVVYDGATPLYGYKLRIRKLSTGQEWLTIGSDAFWTYEPIQWGDRLTPVVGLKRNLKWDSNGISVARGDDVWEITATDGAGVPLSAPVRLNTSVANNSWYYLTFSSRR